MAQIFVEKVNSQLTYLNESSTVSGKTYIGKLAGVAADFTKPTRNGRRYPLELWENVEKSDDFKEMMATMTCFGEADHPSDESNRVDTSIKEIAVVLTKYEIQRDKGVVYCEFLILDTPNGRIIKTLLDAGCKMGVSSRGVGDEVVRNGETIIDPNTYQFYGFDVVVMPAVVAARPAVVESRQRRKQHTNVSLLRTLRREILEASTEKELNAISKILNASKLPDIDSLTESINIRLREIRGGNNISRNSDEGLFEENRQLRAELAKCRYEVKSIRARMNANNIRLGESRQDSTAQSRCESYIAENDTLKRMLSDKESEILSITESAKKSDEMQTSYSRLRKRYNALEEKYNDINIEANKYESTIRKYRNRCEQYEAELSDYQHKLCESNKKDSTIAKLESRISSLERDLRSKTSECEELTNDVNSLHNKVDSLTESLAKANKSQKLTESTQSTQIKKIRNALEETQTENAKTLSGYLSVRCKQENLDEAAVRQLLHGKYTMADVDKVVTDLSDRQRRLDKVPIVLQPRTVSLVESKSVMSEEDRQTMAMLTGANK